MAKPINARSKNSGAVGWKVDVPSKYDFKWVTPSGGFRMRLGQHLAGPLFVAFYLELLHTIVNARYCHPCRNCKNFWFVILRQKLDTNLFTSTRCIFSYYLHSTESEARIVVEAQYNSTRYI